MAASTRRRVLAGCSVRIDQHTFDAYLVSLRAQHVPSDVEVHYAFVADDGGTIVWPDDVVVLPAPQRPPVAQYSVDEGTHRWNVDTFEHLARCKQLLLDYAVAEGYTHIWLVDSDLLCETTTLRSLLACDVDVVSAVFWTAWQQGTQPLPQCWLAHPYDLRGLGMESWEYLNALHSRALVRVLGGGACCLVRTNVLNRLRYHPRLDLPAEGMWQGEDRTFAILAQQAHVRQYADAWPQVYHAYRPSDRTPANLAAQWERLSAPRQLYAKAGDWVNMRLTPMEDPQLEAGVSPTVRNARGRLGRLPLAPELEAALLTIAVGERRIVDVRFGDGHPVYPSGTVRAIMVELVDARPHE